MTDDMPGLDDPTDPLGPPIPRRRRFRAVPMRIVLPNLVTLLALCLGLTAIRQAIDGRMVNAVSLILAAAVLDGLDGRIARALKGTTRFGAELDSLADFVDFGVAPALLLYLWSLHDIKSLGWFAALVFAVACALRLARFNVALDDPDKPAWASDFFVGMPAPAGAIVVMLPMYIQFALGRGVAPHWVVPLEVAYVLGVAGLMASRIPHFSGKRIGRIPRDYFILVLFFLVVLGLLLATYPMEMLALLTLGYLGMIPWSVRRYRLLSAASLPPSAPGVG